MKNKKVMAMIMAAIIASLTACGTTSSVTTNLTEEAGARPGKAAGAEAGTAEQKEEINTEDMFSERDMEQSPDLSEAERIEVSDNKNVTIDTEGIYVISGEAKETTIYVEAGDEDKIQLVLDNVTITNKNMPVIYVKSADKVFITTADVNNSLSVTGEFQADGDTNTDAVIFSKDDLVLNGTGTLTVYSTDNAVTSKDTLKITGGNIVIECKGSALEANDAIEIANGNVDISSCNDGIHAEDSDDDTKGYVYIGGGAFNITADDDAIHAITFVRIDNGSLTLKSAEGIEGTVIQINNGTVDITASDDGINAARKSGSVSPLFEMNGGEVTINMGAGDTDGVDSNGDITINGGTIDITGQSTFDYDGNAIYNGGTIIENGKETNTITNQMMGGMGNRGEMNERNGMNNGDFFKEQGKMRGQGRMQDKQNLAIQ